ncbi:DUF4817 domain-containing protein [Trichonephila clavipes]|nr:DUF4817 domain-containing protein [Trichonephila clavipes]
MSFSSETTLFVEWAQNEIAVVPDFHKRILFSDEAHFWLNGYVNKQNCRIWSEANPQVYVETPLHPEKLTVWCALWAGGITGPYLFKNDEGHNVAVNGAVVPQNGATCHTARATIDLLKDTFDDRLISRFGPVNWPPRSCDLTPLDYFLWGYVKSLTYADKPQTLDHLEDNIRRVIADIRPQMLKKVIENWTSRLDYIRASRGSHMPEILFKMKSQHAVVSDFADVARIHLRRYKLDATGSLLPTKDGITVTPSVWLALVREFSAIDQAFEDGKVFVIKDCLLLSRTVIENVTHIIIQRYFQRKDFTRKFLTPVSMLKETEWNVLKDIHKQITSKTVSIMFGRVF